MGDILSRLGHLFVQSTPTVIFVFLLLVVLDRLFFRRLTEVLREREARTSGALERAREQEKFRNRVAQESGRETRGRVSVAAGARTSGTKIGGRKAKGREAFNPRLFETSDGFGVIVGRNNKENDYVTHHLSKPEDLWFHASGIPGSHVILRKKGKSPPSRKAIEEAAAIAAYFSKGKTSSAVPVIYAEKKYVHRPRGARPGTATCTREKFLMVRPRKPKPALAS